MKLTVRSATSAAAKDVALLPIRASLAATMIYHGVDKLRGERRREVAHQFDKLGIRPGHIWALATGAAETAAGALTLAGALTRPAALAVLVTQGTAIAKVHARHGFPVTKGGFEFNLALMTMAGALLIGGPGRFSLYELLTCVASRAASRRRGSILRRLVGRRPPPTLGMRLVSLLG
jgi:putative oxidoreductase